MSVRQALRETAPLDGALVPMDEAAHWLGISVDTLRGHVRDGRIAYIPVGRGLKRTKRMFDPADLRAFRDAKRTTECQSIQEGRRRSSITTSSSEVIGILERARQLTAERRKPTRS